jgi:type IV fimbrial biogenesis protein FimT
MRNTQHGFTLTELMVSLTVVGILLGVAMPSFRQFSGNSRTVANTNSLVSALAVARSEALRRSTSVSICASADMLSCNSVDWATGWIVFTDPNNPGVVDATEQVIQSWPKPGGTAAVQLTDATNTPIAYLQYTARGMTSLAGQLTFTTWIPGCRGSNQSQIAVTVMGSPQTTKIACP